MGIVVHDDWHLSERGKKDAKRHRDKIERQIRDNIRDVISEESIITKRKGKKVRVPVRGLKDYKFKHGGNNNGKGVGSGDSKPGDVIARDPKKGKGEPGEPGGDDIGDDYMEVEVDIDYLINIMFQDLGLPWIEEKSTAKKLVPKGWKFESISKVGQVSRIHKRRTLKESIQRTVMFIGEIMEETGCDYDLAEKALMQAYGDLEDAIQLVKEGRVDENVEPVTLIEDDDLRYRVIEEDFELHSNAVVIAMMDVSASMDIDKKYLARSMLFWMVEFLKKCYEHVEIRFIVHTTEARIVDEDTFFKKGESGGTLCHTAIDLANDLIESDYPIDEWNVYCMYISDGEDFNPNKTFDSLEYLFHKKINMFGYTEITPMDFGMRTLFDLFKGKDNWNFVKLEKDEATFLRDDNARFLLSKIRNKDHIWEALKWFLFKENV